MPGEPRKSARLESKRTKRVTPAILNRKRKCEMVEEEQMTDVSESVKEVRLDEDESVKFKEDDITSLTWSRFRALSALPVLPDCERRSPLPKLSWADPKEVWDLMVKKDLRYKRNPNVLDQHPAIEASMRSILLDWLIEVCEVYRLHRDSYYLCLDLFDRYLATQENIPKAQLQLVGITALFVAAKIEEIYPPKLKEFAYVTDSACTEKEILDQELMMLKALNWDLSPITAHGWVNIFLQVCNLENIKNPATNFVFPMYAGFDLLQIAKLLDLAMLDIGCLAFSYSMLAASALYHVTSQELTFRVTGYKWDDIQGCVQWMSPFAATTRDQGPVQLKVFDQISEYDMHNIQTHTVDLSLLEDAQARYICAYNEDNRPDFMTPPKSQDKNSSVKSEVQDIF